MECTPILKLLHVQIQQLIFGQQKPTALPYATQFSSLPNKICTEFFQGSMHLCAYISFKYIMKGKYEYFWKGHCGITYVHFKFSLSTLFQCLTLHTVSILFPSMLLETIEVKTSWKKSSGFYTPGFNYF